MKLQTVDDSIAPRLVRIPSHLGDDDPHPKYRLVVEDHDVPYLELMQWVVPSDPKALKSYLAQFEDRSPHLVEAMRQGQRIFDLQLDNRYGCTVTEGELERSAWFWANAMAVSAGYTGHGRTSRPINRHGPSRV